MLMIEGCLTITRLSKVDYIQNQKRKLNTNNSSTILNYNWLPKSSTTRIHNNPNENNDSNNDNILLSDLSSSSTNIGNNQLIHRNQMTNNTVSNTTTTTISSNLQYRNLEKLTQSLSLESTTVGKNNKKTQ